MDSLESDGSREPRRVSRFVDTHFHLDRTENPEAVALHVERAGIYCICVTNLPSEFEFSASITAGCEYLRSAIGLHPEMLSVGIRELDLFFDSLAATRYIGEVGLDYSEGSRSGRFRQRRIFEQVIARCSDWGNKILTIHSRRAADDVVSVLENGFRGQAILHWYSGSLAVLERAAGIGCYVSFNPRSITGKGVAEMLRVVGRGSVLTESDGPFVQFESRGAQPMDVAYVIHWLAQYWQIPTDQAKGQVYQNFARLIRRDVPESEGFLTTTKRENRPEK